MSYHKDFVVNKVNKKNKIKFYQFILNYESVGKVLKKDGAYIKKNNQIICWKKFLKSEYFSFTMAHLIMVFMRLIQITKLKCQN